MRNKSHSSPIKHTRVGEQWASRRAVGRVGEHSGGRASRRRSEKFKERDTVDKGEIVDNDPSFKVVAEEIVGQCKGLPLVIARVGRKLRHRKIVDKIGPVLHFMSG